MAHYHLITKRISAKKLKLRIYEELAAPYDYTILGAETSVSYQATIMQNI